MAKPNFKFQKRQKELAKQAKAEEKRLRKLEKREPESVEDEAIPTVEENLTATPANNT